MDTHQVSRATRLEHGGVRRLGLLHLLQRLRLLLLELRGLRDGGVDGRALRVDDGLLALTEAQHEDHHCEVFAHAPRVWAHEVLQSGAPR